MDADLLALDGRVHEVTHESVTRCQLPLRNHSLTHLQVHRGVGTFELGQHFRVGQLLLANRDFAFPLRNGVDVGLDALVGEREVHVGRGNRSSAEPLRQIPHGFQPLHSAA